MTALTFDVNDPNHMKLKDQLNRRIDVNRIRITSKVEKQQDHEKLSREKAIKYLMKLRNRYHQKVKMPSN